MTALLRIGVNALFLIPEGVGGTEIYIRNLLAALAEIDDHNQYFVFLSAEAAAAAAPVTPSAANFHEVRCAVRATNRPARLLWEQLILPAKVAALRLNVLFSPGFTSPWFTPGCPKVTCIHDLQHMRQPQNFGVFELAAWRAAVWISARFSRQIITVSENSRRDILQIYRLPASRVEVVKHGVEPVFWQLRSHPASDGRPLPVPYLLSVSTIHPHKNWGRWLEAYGKLAAEGWPHHLVIAGLRGKYSEQLARVIESQGLTGRVHVTGWLSRVELLSFFRFADGLVFPSTFEGFGMPVLEAMAAGIPVACSDIPPLRETAGGAALFFDPYSVESIAEAVRKLVSEPELRRQLVEQGLAAAAAFSWTRAAERTLAILRRAAGRAD
jgi:glycosyltransferase involved in cell wall biosynthesis